MGTHRHILKTLRNIALEHASADQPDLASLARELGSVVHRDAAALASRLGALRKRQGRFERVLLARRGSPPLSIVVMAWPANHASSLNEHAGSWGLEMSLVGALEVQALQPGDAGNPMVVQQRHWLGPGDGVWFEGESGGLRRCRNLSRHETALSLHVYGPAPVDRAAPGQLQSDAAVLALPNRPAAAGRLFG